MGDGLDELWVERLERLAAVNEKVNRERMQALTLEEALRRFEQLCREIHTEIDRSSLPRSHPVGLIKYVRSRR
jgi:hypothetical protein